MTSFDSIFADIKSPKKKKKVAPVFTKDHENAEAVVLLEMVIACEGCGAEFKHPNKHMMVRKGRHTFRPAEWLKVHDKLPREHQTYEDTVERCGKCFEVCGLPEGKSPVMKKPWMVEEAEVEG